METVRYYIQKSYFLYLLVISTILMASNTVQAEGVLDCVDPDIASTLLWNPGDQRPEIRLEMPSHFPVTLPSDFKLIGSRESQYFSIVSFKSTLPISSAKPVIEESMVNAGWQKPQVSMPRRQGGFQSTHTRTTQDASRFCHNKHGNITFMFSRSDNNETYLTVMPSKGSGNMCQANQRAALMANYGAFDLMPVLTLPEGARSLGGPGMSGSGNGASSRTKLHTTQSVAGLLLFFSNQLAEQEWLEEGQWAGSFTSGSAWIREDEKVSGLLQVVELGNDEYSLTFNLTKHNQESASFGIVVGD